LFDKLKKTLLQRGNVITFELDEWYKWYKKPQNFHNAVVKHLINEGCKVETVSIVDNVTSNKISTLLIDGAKYELSVRNRLWLGPTQSVFLNKIES